MKIILAIIFLSISLFADKMVIKKGWNLVSLDSKSIALDENMNPNIDIVWTYKNNKWSLFTLKDVNTSGFKIIDSIKPNQGYWIKTNNDFEISYDSTEEDFDLQNKNLNIGWNLISTFQDINDLSIFKDTKIIWIYKNNKWSAYSPIPKVQNLIKSKSSINTITSIPKYSGFWLNTDYLNTKLGYGYITKNEGGIIKTNFILFPEGEIIVQIPPQAINTNKITKVSIVKTNNNELDALPNIKIVSDVNFTKDINITYRLSKFIKNKYNITSDIFNNKNTQPPLSDLPLFKTNTEELNEDDISFKIKGGVNIVNIVVNFIKNGIKSVAKDLTKEAIIKAVGYGADSYYNHLENNKFIVKDNDIKTFFKKYHFAKCTQIEKDINF